MMVEFPEALFDRLRAGDVVLCTGVGFAAAAGMPSWETVLSRMCDKLGPDSATVKELIAAGHLLTAAGYLKRKLGNDSLAALIAEAYAKNGQPSKPHEALAGMPFFAALNTGYDPLLAQAIGGNGGRPKVYTYTDGAVLRLADDLKRFVVMAHGQPDLPGKLVVSRLDYKRLIAPNQAYRSFIEDLYRSRTLLLVGYRANDPDFLLLLDRLLAGFRDAVSDHYAILPALPAPEVEELYANHRLRVIPYDEGADPAAALTAVLEALREAWRAKGPGADEADDPVVWLRRQVLSVQRRIDVVAGEGLTLPEGRLTRINEVASSIELRKLDAETLCRLGNIRLYLGEIDGAIACYDAALAAEPDNAVAHLNLHHAQAEASRFGQALEHLKRATELDESLRVVPRRFELKAVIGRGTTGTVYHAHDAEKNRDVTVKVLRVSFVREHVSPERWLTETEILTRLQHRNIARVFEAMHEGGRCVLVTESLSGQSLSRLLSAGGTLSPEKAAELLGQVCAGLQHAHEQGVLHLDLTPSNIFLRDDGSVAVMDFRSGRAQKGRHVTVKKGSEGFQAPELLAGAGADARADVYALGALLYAMLTGKVPIGSFPRLADANPAARRFQSLVSRALRAVPDERPASVAEFARILAGSGEAVALPEREDDLAGWLEVLAYQPDNAQAAAALAALEERYRQGKDWENLVTMLLGRVELAPEAESRLRMLREVGRVFELEVGDLGKAFTAMAAAFREASSSIEIRKDLERLAGATGMWNELLQEYTNLVQGVRDPKVAGDWWVVIGRLYAHELGHHDYAVAAFNQALSIDANRADALAELVEVVKRKGDHRERARLLSRMAELEENTARKIDLLKELAQVCAKDLASEEEAILAYRRILDADPASGVALRALEKLYRKAQMWEELVELLRGAVDRVEIAADQQVYRRSLAEALADHLQRPAEAIEHYEKILETDADDANALKSLERLYEATGRDAEYLRILDQRIAATPGDAEKVALYRRLAAEWEEQPGGKRRAAEYLEKAAALGGASEEVYKALIRVYWELKEYDRLAKAYEEQVRLCESPEDRAVLYAALGRVQEDHLKQPQRALETYNSLLALDAENRIALAALARLYESSGAWAQAAQMLERLASKEAVERQVEIYTRIGQLQQEKLSRPDQAEANLVKALELKDDHTPALLALAQLNNARKDYGKAARLMREAAQHTANALERVERSFEAARIYQDLLADEGKALEVLEELLVFDPEHVAAAERALALYELRGEAGKAQPLLEMLVRKSDAKERERLVAFNLRLGDLHAKSGDPVKATTAYRAAYEADPTARETLQRLANQLYDRGEKEEAGKLYQALLVHRRDAMEPKEIVHVFLRLGEIKNAVGEPQKALNMFEKALDVDGANPEALSRIIEAYEQKGDHEAVLRAKKNRLKALGDGDEKVALLEDIGDLLRGQLKRSKEAVTYYEQVLKQRPENRRVLNKTMEAYVEQKHWDGAIQVIKKLIALETDAGHQYRLHYTAAIILRDELKRSREAAQEFDRALEADPTNMRAFRALEALLIEQGNYEGLVKSYRRMLKRLPESTPKPEQVELWHELGRICMEKLKDGRGAIVAFEVAAKLDPTDVARQENLARLYLSAGPDAFEKAIQVNQRLLLHNPMRLEAYKELRRLYVERGEVDKTWCVCAALTLLNKATAEEQAIYDRYRPKQPRRAKARISDEIYRECVRHGRQGPILDELFAAVAPLIVPMAVRPRSAYSLKVGEKLAPEKDTRPWAAAYRYAVEVIGRHPDELYLRADLPDRVGVAHVGSAAQCDSLLWVHPGVVDPATPERDLLYHFGRALALLRPEHLLYAVTGSATVLRAVVLASLRLAQPGMRVSGDVAEIEKLAAVLRTDLQPRHAELITRVDELREAAAAGAIERWIGAADAALSRAGLLLCDDLPTAARLAVTHPAAEGQLPPKQRVAELVVYAVSEQYFRARELLGFKVG